MSDLKPMNIRETGADVLSKIRMMERREDELLRRLEEQSERFSADITALEKQIWELRHKLASAL